MQGKVRTALLGGATLALTAATASAATIVAENFESLASSGLPSNNTFTLIPGTTVYEYGNEGNTLARRTGANSNYSLGVGNGIPLSTGTPVMIGAVTHFSMVGGVNMPSDNAAGNTNQGGSMGFGWTTAQHAFNAYDGGSGIADATVARTQHVTVGLAKVSTGDFGGTNPLPDFRLAYGNGVSQHMTNQFGTAATKLTAAHWYRLDGTISYLGYSAGTNTSTFNFTASLYDLGMSGADNPVAAVLSGSEQLVLTGDYGTQGMPVFYANAGRGVNRIDNIMAEAVPEPASLSLLGIVSFLAMGRRRCI